MLFGKGRNVMKLYLKKVSMLLALVMIIVSLAACGKVEKANSDNAELDPQNNDIIDDSELSIVEVSDSSEFEDELGIKIDSTILSEDATLSILNKEIAEVSYTTTAVNGFDVVCTLRITKNAKLKDKLVDVDLSGIESVQTITMDLKSGQVDLENYYYEDPVLTIYTFEINGTYYAFTIGDGLSQMTIGGMLDALFESIGEAVYEN